MRFASARKQTLFLIGALVVALPSLSWAQFGACCGGHGGVCGCKHGGVVCCDGFEGSSCPCSEEDELKVPEKEAPATAAPIKQAPKVSPQPPAQGYVAPAKHKQFLSNPELTPGDVRSTNVDEICAPGYISRLPRAAEEDKDATYEAYGISDRRKYGIDHLISKGLGGSSNPRNLWPQSYHGPWPMPLKDRLENHLHKLLCEHQISVEEAQNAIRTDWVAAYKKYLGLPKVEHMPPSRAAGKLKPAKGKSKQPAKGPKSAAPSKKKH
ncbi:MAG: hypothetical protein K1X79_04090 [Oligoflexia bacterium]|nr:hypothetical protein [Oligoflexia bacterium]